MKLRPYQEKALADLYGWFESHPEGHPIVEACVASGKSLLIAEFCRRAIAEFEGTRILMVVHVKELVQQNVEQLLTLWPDAPVGVCSASLKATNTSAQIIFGTIQTIANRAEQIGHVDLMIVDECHLINTADTGTYRKLISKYLAMNDNFRVIGFTGTPFRGDGVYLTDGKSPLFTHITGRVQIKDLMKQGYLSKITTANTETKSDVSGVEIDRMTGDYKMDQLSAALNKESYIEGAVTEAIKLAVDRKKIMVFCADIKHCHAVADAFEARGETVRFLTSLDSNAHREETIEQFKKGEFRWLVNVAILTTGFNVPDIDCICLMRNTVSPVLYVQIVGRGLRLAEGKTDCLWLDFTDTTSSMGPVDLIKGKPRPPEKSGTMPTKFCPECGNPNPTAVLVCGDCGYEWPLRERVLALSNAPIVSTEKSKPAWFPVRSTYYGAHLKEGKLPIVRVEYRNNLVTIASEYLSVHPWANKYALGKAKEWVFLRLADRSQMSVFVKLLDQDPEDFKIEPILLFLREHLKETDQVKLQKEGKFWTVCGHLLKENQEGEEFESERTEGYANYVGKGTEGFASTDLF